jgi:cytoskeletal protein RodZ
MLKKFAEELKEARKKSGITLQQIHSKTRIDLKFLEAIENGNFEVLPEVYLRAIIKEYSVFVGLDDKIQLNRYDLAKAGKLFNEEPITEKEEKESVKSHQIKKVFTGSEGAPQSASDDNSPKQVKLNPKLIFISLAAIVLLVFVYMIFFKASSGEIVTERPYDEVISENKNRYEPESNTSKTIASDKSVFSSKDSLVLLIRSKDTSWVGITVDNSANISDFILFPSQQKRIKALRNFQVTIGNAKSIEMSLNEKPLNFSGNYKEVKFVKIDSTGLSYITPQKVEIKKND